MSDLTSAQLNTLKSDILSNPLFSGWNLATSAQEIAAEYNKVYSPDFIVWKTSVTPVEWREAIIGGGGATQLDALTASKRDALLWAVDDVLNPSNSNIRSALDDFCGTQNTLKAAIQAVQKRKATRAEKLFSSGTGTLASPATMSFEGQLTYQQVESALILAGIKA